MDHKNPWTATSQKKANAALTVIVQKPSIHNLRASRDSGRPRPTEFVYAPSNAFFEIGHGVSYVRRSFLAGDVALPDEWNNFTAPPGDPHPERYQLSTRPMDQQRCGACFACSVATALNDVFIFGQSLSYNPDLSPMSILSCVNNPSANLKCGGGNPIQVVVNLAAIGIVSNHCMDYNSMCSASDGCSRGKKAPLSSFVIPECKGCRTADCDPVPTSLRYYPKPPTFVSETSGYDANYRPVPGNTDAVPLIKHHLLRFGSVVSGFVVFSNFLKDRDNGLFRSTYGVYIETEPYNDAVPAKPSDAGLEFDSGVAPNQSPTTYRGCHAIVIVGWGIERRPIQLASGKTIPSTPYWLVRNSWGSHWGDNGYCKMAMYQKLADGTEINPKTSFERYRLYTGMDSNNNPVIAPIGGVLLLEPSSIKPDRKTPISAGDIPDDLKAFYCSDSYQHPSAPSDPVSTSVPSGDGETEAPSGATKTMIAQSGGGDAMPVVKSNLGSGQPLADMNSVRMIVGVIVGLLVIAAGVMWWRKRKA